MSLSTFVPCWPDLYWTCAIGVSLSVANNHALAIFVYLLTSLFYLRDACVICLHKKQKTHTLSNLSFLVTSLSHAYSFCTLTHSPSHALDLSRPRHSLRSIAYRFIEKSNITKFDHVHGEKHLHLEWQTYIIRFIMRCSFE